MSQLMSRFCIITLIILAGAFRSYSQNATPDVFKQGTLSEQIQYLNERTRIYENYRAIREDMFQIASKNLLDSVAKAKNTINELTGQTGILGDRIDSLNKSLEAATHKLDIATSTKDSIHVLGLEVNKVTYNSVMWTLLASLVFLLIVGYLSFRRNRVITVRTRKDLEELKEEFEAYRQKVRIEREKTNLEHFNEIKKLKAGAAGKR
jgi:hypothetical protein